jgi:tetratricopeptide (TPR) repeat protein
MKVVHKNAGGDDDGEDMLARAKRLEKQDDMDAAIALYKKIIQKNPVHEYAYNRLMIIHRKTRDYKKEKAVIDEAIKAFQQFYSVSLKLSATPKIKALSKAISKATGLADKNTGKLIYEREPIYRWNKRRELVIKKIEE